MNHAIGKPKMIAAPCSECLMYGEIMHIVYQETIEYQTLKLTPVVFCAEHCVYCNSDKELIEQKLREPLKNMSPY